MLSKRKTDMASSNVRTREEKIRTPSDYAMHFERLCGREKKAKKEEESTIYYNNIKHRTNQFVNRLMDC